MSGDIGLDLTRWGFVFMVAWTMVVVIRTRFIEADSNRRRDAFIKLRDVPGPDLDDEERAIVEQGRREGL